MSAKKEQDYLTSAALYDAAMKMLGEALLLAFNGSSEQDIPLADFAKIHLTEYNNIVQDVVDAAEYILTDPR